MTYIYSLTSNRLISLTRVLVSTSVIKYCSVAHTNMFSRDPQCKVNKKRLFSGNMASSRKKSTKLSFLLLFLLSVKPGELNPGPKRPNLYGITLLYTILKKQNALMRIIQSISFIQSAFLNLNWIHSFHLLNKT